MINASFKTLRQAERDYPGILKQVREIEANPSQTTATGIIGRTITLASLTTKFQIRPRNNPSKNG